ncbi:MAG: MerR family transcriptional regulator [Rhodospirillales bacterium]
MALRLQEVVSVVHCRQDDLEFWITERWVRPIRDDTGYLFAEADIARIHLIRDLVEDMAVERDTVPMVLSLIDQVHGAHRHLARLVDAIDALPEPTRGELLRRAGLPKD